jgi:hypothetical protein
MSTFRPNPFAPPYVPPSAEFIGSAELEGLMRSVPPAYPIVRQSGHCDEAFIPPPCQLTRQKSEPVFVNAAAIDAVRKFGLYEYIWKARGETLYRDILDDRAIILAQLEYLDSISA